MISDDTPLPESALRGLRSPKFKYEGEDTVTFEAFLPDGDTGTKHDGKWVETSITWNDGPEAVDVQRRDKQNCAFGIAVVTRVVLEGVAQKAAITPHFRYRRSGTAHNPHHGDLLFSSNHKLSKKKQRDAATLLACDSKLLRDG